MTYIPPNPNGQAVSASSAPVVIASDQSALPVKPSPGASASGNITTQNLLGNNVPATAGSSVELTLAGASTVALQVTGTWTGTLAVQVTIDGTNWLTLSVVRTEIYSRGTGAMVGTITANGVYAADVAGATKMRLVATAPVTGTAAVTLAAVAEPSVVTVNLPTGANTIGAVTIAAALPAGTNQIGVVTQALAFGFGTITTQNLVPAGAATAGSAVEIPLGVTSGLAIQVTGVYTGALSLQGTLDGATWVTLGGLPLINLGNGGYVAAIPSGVVGIFQANVGGMFKARVTALGAVTGTATISLTALADPAMRPATVVVPTPVQVEPSATPAITAVAYTAGWQLGAVLTFAAAAASGRGGQVVGARLLDKAKQNAALVLDLFEVSPTLVGANAAPYDITDANAVTAQWIGSIDFATANYRARASNSSCFGSVNGGAPILPFVTSGSANIFGVLYTTGTPTYASTTDLIVTLTIAQF